MFINAEKLSAEREREFYAICVGKPACFWCWTVTVVFTDAPVC